MNLSEIEYLLNIHVAGNVGTYSPTIACDQDGTVERLFFLSSLIRRLVLHYLEQQGRSPQICTVYQGVTF